MVVDDERSIVDAVATALRYEGYEVAEAFNGRDALTTAADFELDLVVLDSDAAGHRRNRVGGASARAASEGGGVLFLDRQGRTGEKGRRKRCARAATTT